MIGEITEFIPHVVIVDPLTSLMDSGADSEGKGMIARLIDFLKATQVTSPFTSLTQGGHALQVKMCFRKAWVVVRCRCSVSLEIF